MGRIIFLLLVLTVNGMAQNNQALQSLGNEFFEWRSITQPATGDDIPRVERPDGWTPDYSPQAIASYRNKYLEFKQRLNAIPKEGWTRSDSVDFLLLRSATERVNWELNVLRLPQRSPDFYVDQTLGSVFELLLIHTPMTDQRAKNIILRLQAIPRTVQDARTNLTEPVAAFAEIALDNLRDITTKLQQTSAALKESTRPAFHSQLDKASQDAAAALVQFAEWLEKEGPEMGGQYYVGRAGYAYFLKYIALVPYSPEQLLSMGRLEWNRSVAFDIYENLRDRDIPQPALFASADEQIKQSRKDEEAIRAFLQEKHIMSIPEWVGHYINEKLPPRVAPLAYMGVTDDLTSASRLDQNGVSYIPEPSPDLSFFHLASAQDPRPIIVHEGVPGHYLQLVLSWANPDPIRRHYFDSGANEGIGFYVEELLQQFGLFDDRPHTRAIIYRFMRLRALRVDVDVNLALGDYTIEQAGKYLASTVPMDLPTAIHEAGFFALTPGQAISYQIGKLQIMDLIADAKIKLGDQFNLQDYHDYMMVNGNVPIALQRWEYVGSSDEIEQLW